MTTMMDRMALEELTRRHLDLYAGPDLEPRLKAIVRLGPHSRLALDELLNILRLSRSIFFETHVETVSGHHTATYLRFESIARFPELVAPIARDMVDWIGRTFRDRPLAGIVATTSAAQTLATAIAEHLGGRMPLRTTFTPYNGETGRIGTDIASGTIHAGERFLSLNDVTTRGQCVRKLGNVITDHGGILAGMAVFARRDSGQFPLMDELMSTYPFYYTVDLLMPQWEPMDCPLCRQDGPLLSWREMPAL
jgi:orotate phosphoribosyltransferase